MNYFGASINQSSTISERTGSNILNGEFRAVKCDVDGNVVLCDTLGENVFGVLLPETPKEVVTGEYVSIQIKDIGICMSGASFKKGAELMTDARGRFVPAVSEKFIAGYAMQKADNADEIVQVDIRKGGYKA